MKTTATNYRGYRFPSEIISHGVWLYHRFCLSFRDVEELLTKRGILVSYETIRQWCRKFGPEYARKLKRREGRLGDIWHLDEVSVKIGIASAHATTRAPDAKVQVSRPSTAIPIGPRGHSELLQIRAPPDALRKLPIASCPIFQRVEYGHRRLSNPGRPRALA